MVKYSKNNQPIVCMHTSSRCYEKTYEMKVLGVLWHSTGANNPKLMRYVQPSNDDPNYDQLMKLLGDNPYNNDWNKDNLSKGVNAFVGKLADGTVASVQTLPWNYRPWGCGSGAKGSCNNGWIQFEICEYTLTDKDYFNKVYTEACELTAYLCDMYNLDPYGTVDVNGVQTPVILCHGDANRLGLASSHEDVLHWFEKQGKTMDDVRADVAKLLKKPGATQPSTVEFTVGEEVKLVSGAKYTSGKSIPTWVFNSKIYVREIQGNNIVISTLKTGAITGVVAAKYLQKIAKNEPSVTDVELAVGDQVMIQAGAVYTSGKAVPKWVTNSNVYVRKIDGNKVTISTLKTGAITGVVDERYLIKKALPPTYKVKVTASALNIRSGAGTNYSVIGCIRDGGTYTIVKEQNGWGKLGETDGWISLQYTKKV